MRAQRYVVLPDEAAVEFAALQTALFAELAPAGALQLVLARRIAIAAWRLARADRLETEVFAERQWDGAGAGVALIRDGNGTRSFETIMRYRSAAMAEFMRALRTLKALQAEQAAADAPGPRQSGGRRLAPNEPEPAGAHRLQYGISGRPEPGGVLHEPTAPWLPNEPEGAPDRHEAAVAFPTQSSGG